MPAISDSSPLILYARINRLSLLQDLFTQVLIPSAVRVEVVRAARGRAGAAEVTAAQWIRDGVLLLSPGHTVPSGLHLGEDEAILLALQMGRHLPVLLDDRRARQYAYAQHLRVLGSVGILALAKRRGLVPAVAPIVAELREAGLYLRDNVVAELLQSVNET